MYYKCEKLFEDGYDIGNMLCVYFYSYLRFFFLVRLRILRIFMSGLEKSMFKYFC